jgi:hypothetical protein
MFWATAGWASVTNKVAAIRSRIEE